MGKLKKERAKQPWGRFSGLSKRWGANILSVICIIGLVCVLLVTTVFAAYYYTSMEADMRRRAEDTANFFADYLNQNYTDYYQSCITYTRTFEDRNSLELQFITVEGDVVVSSYGHWAGKSPTTSDITDAVEKRQIGRFVGADPVTGERIMAVSSPMIYGDGEVMGVLRYVTSTRLIDRQIFLIALSATGAFFVILAAVLFSGTFFIRSILNPVDQITQKA